MRIHIKLYRSTNYDQWFASSPAFGWVTFPAEIDGWQKRQSARGLKPLGLTEVPIHMGFNTGIPGAPCAAGGRATTQLVKAA